MAFTTRLALLLVCTCAVVVHGASLSSRKDGSNGRMEDMEDEDMEKVFVKPWFCQKYDCPPYISEDFGPYEIRNYTESWWAAFSVSSRRSSPSYGQINYVFKKLYKYINGENEKEEDMKMTVPVLTKVEDLDGKDRRTARRKHRGRRTRYRYRVTMMFYLTSPDPPAPTSRGVYLVKRPTGNVYIRSFPRRWRPSRSEYASEVEQMERVLAEDEMPFEPDVYYKAEYNPPWHWFRKKQFEVWVDSYINANATQIID